MNIKTFDFANKFYYFSDCNINQNVINLCIK